MITTIKIWITEWSIYKRAGLGPLPPQIARVDGLSANNKSEGDSAEATEAIQPRRHTNPPNTHTHTHVLRHGPPAQASWREKACSHHKVEIFTTTLTLHCGSEGIRSLARQCEDTPAQQKKKRTSPDSWLKILRGTLANHWLHLRSNFPSPKHRIPL